MPTQNSVSRSISVPMLACIVATLITTVYGLASYLPDDVENFQFPRILAALMVILCVMLWFNLLSTKQTTEGGDSSSGDSRFFSNVLPGLLIGGVYVAVLETLGFYVSSFLAFFAISIIYSNESIEFKSVLKKVAIAVIFMSVLYLLFWKGLYVRTPQGLLF